MSKTCPKCGRVRTEQDPSSEECPRCGIIYSRYQAAMISKMQKRNASPDIDDPGERLQHEIQKRVVEHEKYLQEARERELQTRATLQALEDITEVPIDKSKEIAEQVQLEYELSQARLQAKMQTRRRLLRFGLIAGCVVLVGSGIHVFQNFRRQAKRSQWKGTKKVFGSRLAEISTDDIRILSLSPDTSASLYVDEIIRFTAEIEYNLVSVNTATVSLIVQERTKSGGSLLSYVNDKVLKGQGTITLSVDARIPPTATAIQVFTPLYLKAGRGTNIGDSYMYQFIEH